MPKELTQERLKEMLDYDPDTGIFRWKVPRPLISVGTVAGHETEFGYIRITVDGHRYMAHVLAWLWMTGDWCPKMVDHCDTMRSNNIWTNLRRATRSQNMHNSRLRSDNRAGLKGARYISGGANRKKRYAAVIKIGEKQKTLGYFLTAQEAHAAYAAKAEELFGEFARAS